MVVTYREVNSWVIKGCQMSPQRKVGRKKVERVERTGYAVMIVCFFFFLFSSVNSVGEGLEEMCFSRMHGIRAGTGDGNRVAAAQRQFNTETLAQGEAVHHLIRALTINT